ncbi:MAG TPA: aminoacyl--tRNA ligase-related protein [Candidatus Dormibacteraeota bacterium]|nr:aminoacyl--tRNA ligase-related protein [Candidatus Dormibacteraeota bacterium]
MRLSTLFTKTSKTVLADETAKNAKLLIQAGFIHKEMAGVYAYLPLGLKVLENIKNIVREEMNAIGGQEIIMTSLQRQELWEITDRWDDQKVDIWFKSQLKNGTSVGFGWSHEEPITYMMKNYINSYRDLPAKPYQFQTKLRNELRAKSGILRGREFVMKDLYSYSRNETEHQQFYDSVKEAYLRIFERVGLGEITYLTFASGGSFTQFSHEFQAIIGAGEDTIYVDKERRLAINQEVLTDEILKQLKLVPDKLETFKAAEIGNIFSFGVKKSQQLGLYFADEDGSQKPVILGSYGIGITRLMGVIVEHFSDEKGLVWPSSVAPAAVYIARLGEKPEVVKTADKLYADLTDSGIGVIYDDRDIRPGQKFADADLMGIPARVVVSDKSVAANQYEVKWRQQSQVRHLTRQKLFEKLGV